MPELTLTNAAIALAALIVAAACLYLLARGVAAAGRYAVNAPTVHKSKVRDAVAAGAQYVFLFWFVAVTMGLSAQGLIRFAADNMGLAEPWPHLIFFALDGAAGMCAVLMARRAGRGESAVAPRLAVWGIVAASAVFNYEQAPDRPGAHLAFAVFPIIGATLFEFCLREIRRTAVIAAERRIPGIRWLHLIERIRVQLALAADEAATVTTATRQVRQQIAARRLYGLRQALARKGRFSGMAVAHAERRAQAALMRAGFVDQGEAVEVLRGVQVLTQARTLAGLDYAKADGARMVLANLISVAPQPLDAVSDGSRAVVPGERVETGADGSSDSPDGLAGGSSWLFGNQAPGGFPPVVLPVLSTPAPVVSPGASEVVSEPTDVDETRSGDQARNHGEDSEPTPPRPRRKTTRGRSRTADQSLNERAVKTYLDSVKNEDPLSERALAERFGKTKTWGRARIAEAKNQPGLYVVEADDEERNRDRAAGE